MVGQVYYRMLHVSLQQSRSLRGGLIVSRLDFEYLQGTKKIVSITTTKLRTCILFKKKGNKTVDWMLVAGNIFGVETRIADCLFCKYWGGDDGDQAGAIFPMLGGLELAR